MQSSPDKMHQKLLLTIFDFPFKPKEEKIKPKKQIIIPEVKLSDN